MPVFVSDKNKFLDIAKNAIECRIKRLDRKGVVKLKARTKRYLYTYVVPSGEATTVIEELKGVCKSIKEV